MKIFCLAISFPVVPCFIVKVKTVEKVKMVYTVEKVKMVYTVEKVKVKYFVKK